VTFLTTVRTHRPNATLPRFHLRPLACALCAAFVSPAMAAGESARETGILTPRIDVVGSRAGDIAKIPGAVSVVTKEDLKLLQPLSTEAALRNVPGIVIKPEEESAVVVNFGIRGLSAADLKVLILEDGVPVSPGLFVGNARYYSPRIQRMEGIEVLKGAASLRYGPSTIGGVINFKTKQPQPGFALSGQLGSWGQQEAVVEAGGRTDSGNAVGGINVVKSKSDGFMGKGYDMTDIMLKGGIALTDNQWLGAKYTRYENEANISYRGILLDGYNQKARYNPAPDDYFVSDRDSLDLNHEWSLSSDMRLNTVVYWSQVTRDYWRFNTVTGTPVVGGRWNYSDTVIGNNRSFDRIGVDSRLFVNHQSFGMANEAELGVRLSKESMDDVRVVATRAAPRSGPVTADIRQSATSLALFAQNRFVVDERLAVTPGLRMESYEQKTENRLNGALNGSTTNTEFMPGVGATYQVAPIAQVYGGVYRAFAPAQNADAINNGVDQRLEAERSMNYEVGVRGGDTAIKYELAAFMMNFGNQVIPSNSGGFVRANGGKTEHRGIEAALSYQLPAGFNVSGNFTWVPEAKFVGGANNGKRVTYTPEIVGTLSLGYVRDKFKGALVVTHVGAQFTDEVNTVPVTESTTGFFTGKLAAYTLVDLNTYYDVDKKLSLFASLRNLTDRHYMASLRQGIYVGPSRNFTVGIRYQF